MKIVARVVYPRVGSGGGLHANEIIQSLPIQFKVIAFKDLGEDSNYWGKDVNDERYAIIADKYR